MSFWKGVKSFLGFDGVANSALKIVDKIAGTDWTPQQKAEYVLQYMEKTKHQSPARRLIATIFVVEHMLFGLAWLLGTLSFTLMGVEGGKELASSILLYMKTNVNLTVDIVVGFYFLSHVIKDRK